jgi:hypothetical protein
MTFAEGYGGCQSHHIIGASASHVKQRKRLKIKPNKASNEMHTFFLQLFKAALGIELLNLLARWSDETLSNKGLEA